MYSSAAKARKSSYAHCTGGCIGQYGTGSTWGNKCWLQTTAGHRLSEVLSIKTTDLNMALGQHLQGPTSGKAGLGSQPRSACTQRAKPKRILCLGEKTQFKKATPFSDRSSNTHSAAYMSEAKIKDVKGKLLFPLFLMHFSLSLHCIIL